jgi:hypothetical protein
MDGEYGTKSPDTMSFSCLMKPLSLLYPVADTRLLRQTQATS